MYEHSQYFAAQPGSHNFSIYLEPNTWKTWVYGVYMRLAVFQSKEGEQDPAFIEAKIVKPRFEVSCAGSVQRIDEFLDQDQVTKLPHVPMKREGHVPPGVFVSRHAAPACPVSQARQAQNYAKVSVCPGIFTLHATTLILSSSRSCLAPLEGLLL